MIPTSAGDLLEVLPLVGTFFGQPAMMGGGWTSRLSREARIARVIEDFRGRSGLISSLILDLTGIGMPHQRIQQMVSRLNTP